MTINLPHSPEAERALLGSILVDNTNLDRVLSVLGEEHFYLEAHRIILREMQELYQKGEFDLLVLTESLKRKNLLSKVGGAQYVASLVDGVLEGQDPGPYIEIVLEDYKKRKVIEEIERVKERIGTDLESADLIINELQERLFTISGEKPQGFIHIEEATDEALEFAEAAKNSTSAITGVRTGLSDLDHMTTGFHKGELIVIAGRPGTGKTALALTIALNAATRTGNNPNPVPVAFFSLEMSKLQLGLRMLSIKSQIPMERIRSGSIDQKDMEKLVRIQAEISHLPIYVDTTPALTTAELLARARRIKKEKNIGLVIVDYLQLMKAPGARDNRVMEVSLISSSLKELAKRLDVPVIALSQLNREPEKRHSLPRPRLSDLRESGTIEQDADTVLLLYRDEFYDDQPTDANRNITEVIVAKQRSGPQGKTVLLLFKSELTLFVNLADEAKHRYWEYMENVRESKFRRKRKTQG